MYDNFHYDAALEHSIYVNQICSVTTPITKMNGVSCAKNTRDQMKITSKMHFCVEE